MPLFYTVLRFKSTFGIYIRLWLIMNVVINNFMLNETSLDRVFTRLKKKIENNSTWESAFYQSEWVKINSSWVTFIFFAILCVLLLMHPNSFVWPIYQIFNAFYTILTFHLKYQIFYECKIANFSWCKATQVREGAFSHGNEWN